MGERIFENIHHIEFGGTHVRVWAKTADLRNFEERQAQREAIRNAGNVAYTNTLSAEQDIAVAEAIGALPFCNAVEVKHSLLKCGVLVYPDWP